MLCNISVSSNTKGNVLLVKTLAFLGGAEDFCFNTISALRGEFAASG